MPTVGRTLATERVRQRFDLDDVERATKIPQRSLKSIEADDFDQLPGLVFARNFVRQYAEFLRLDSTAVGQQFDAEQNLAEPAFVMPRSRFKVPKMGGPTISSSSESNTASAFMTFVLTIIVCAGIYYAYLFLRNRTAQHAPEPTPVAAAAATVPPKQAAQPASAPPPAIAQPVSTPVPALDAAPAPQPDASPVRVQISAADACWTRITADGKVLFAGMLNPGEKRDVAATAAVIIRAGNAGGISLKLNGNDVPAIGPKGQVRTITLTPAGAQVQAPEPDVVPPA